MRDLQRRLTRELDEIADRATTSPTAHDRIRSRAFAYHTEQEEEVVVMLTPSNSAPRRPRWLAPTALATAAAGVLIAAGAIVLRDDGPELVSDGSSTTSPEAPVDVFDFAEHDLCEWVDEEQVADIVAYTTGWEGAVFYTAPGGGSGCTWRLRSPSAETAVVEVADAENFEWFNGDPVDWAVTFDDALPYVPADDPDDPGRIPIGATVTGHPDVSPEVTVHNNGFGVHVLTTPGVDAYAAVSFSRTDVWSTGELLSIGDALLHEMGWISGTTATVAMSFDFAEHDLCDWVTASELETIVHDAYTTHRATPIPTGFTRMGGLAGGCDWMYEMGNATGHVTVIQAEGAASSPRPFVSHPALSDGVRVDADEATFAGSYGTFIPGMNVHVAVEGQPMTIQFVHGAPPGYRGGAAAYLAVADGLLREMGWVAAAAPVPEPYFEFAAAELCESDETPSGVPSWLTPETVAGIVADETGWTGTATLTPTGNRPGCEWQLTNDRGEIVSVTAVDARTWLDFDLAPYDFDALPDPTPYRQDPLLDDPWGIAIGAVVSGHPDLTDGVIVHNGGFGQYAFWVEGLGEYLQIDVIGPDGFPDTDQLFSIADGFIEELGWIG